MTENWQPAEMQKHLDTQVAFNADRVHFRFRWDQPDPGGWIHDMLVYHEGKWQQFADPSPWVTGDDGPAHTGFYEDRVSFLLDDGSVKGFEEFGGWLTAHEGMRSLPSAASAAEVQAHDHYGAGGLDKTDIRKYIPQTCAGEWWENDWRQVKSREELEQLKREGVFLDLPMWRAHRSDPVGYGTDAHVLDYRHSDQGRKTYTTQEWDPEDGPELMWDPMVVDDGALDYHAIRDGEFPAQGEDTYALELDDAVAFDPSVAEWEGAMIPRRPLREPSGSAADWKATGTWADGEWVIEMWRDLQTDHPLDTTQLEPGGVYTWTPAVHHGAGKRWHWVGYPYKLGLGVEPDHPGAGHTDEPTELVATRFSGETPNWDRVETYTLPLVFPGLLIWDDLVDESHPRSDDVRDAAVTMWELHEIEAAAFDPR